MLTRRWPAVLLAAVLFIVVFVFVGLSLSFAQAGDSFMYLPFIRHDATPTPTATPTQTPTPTPTPSPTPGNYLDTFDTPGTGWDIVRRQADDADNEVIYRGDGVLQIEVDEKESYALVSPLILLPEPPFKIEIEAEFGNADRVENDRDIYAVIIGGSLDGSPVDCPNSIFDSCFDAYHALLVQIRDGSSLRYKFVEVREHDSDNYPRFRELSPWRTVEMDDLEGDGADEYHEWDVQYKDDDIDIDINDNFLETYRNIDLNGSYFGLAVFTMETNDDARVKFEYFELEER